MVSFPIVGDADGAALVAWTTTPWTLPSNLALCVNPEFTYVRVRCAALAIAAAAAAAAGPLSVLVWMAPSRVPH